MGKKNFFLMFLLILINSSYSQKVDISTKIISYINSNKQHGESSEIQLNNQKINFQKDNLQLLYISKTFAASVQKTINLTSGNLLSLLTPSELSTISDLIITGTMDSRDFKTIRDKMTAISTLNLSGVSITAYSGSEGTDTVGKIKVYEENAIPQFALWNSETKVVNSLSSIILPLNISSIKRYAFTGQSFSSINIPNSIKTIEFASFYNCKSLTSVILNGNGEAVVAASAFRSCTALTTAKIGIGVKSIGDRVFQDCNKLTTVGISYDLESIGNWTFWNCASLAAINVNGENKNFASIDGVLFNKDKTTLVQFPQAKITTYSVPESVSIIGVGAFGSANKLVSVTIPNNVTTVGDWAFEACTGIISVTIPENITTIGDGAFYGCSNLTNVYFNASNCTKMGSHDSPVFYTSGLTALKIGDNVKLIPDWAFGFCSKLTSVTIGNKVEIIGQGGFINCIKLVSVVFPNSVTIIENDAFNSCSALTSITIPYNVSKIGGWAFYNCSSLGSVNFDAVNCSTMGSINYPVFYNCSALTLKIGNEVLSIPAYAFYNCNSLISVTIGSGVTSIGSSAFSRCTNLTTVNFKAINCTYMGGGSSLMTVFPYCDAFSTLNIGNEVTTIPDYAFCLCVNLTSITIGNNVKSIGKKAFQTCRSIKSISIPNSVTIIGDGAFFQDSALTSVSIGNGVTTIGNLAFYCSGLAEITSHNPIPPNLGETVFEGVPINTCVLKVLGASINSYKSTDQWKDFGNIVAVDMSPVVSVSENEISAKITNEGILISGCNPQDKVQIYNIKGQEMYNTFINNGIINFKMKRGMMYILKTPDKTFKLVN